MEEADEMCDEVAIMNLGTIAALGTVKKLKAGTKKRNATLEDAFIFFTNNTMSEVANFSDVRRMRQAERRLG